MYTLTSYERKINVLLQGLGRGKKGSGEKATEDLSLSIQLYPCLKMIKMNNRMLWCTCKMLPHQEVWLSTSEPTKPEIDSGLNRVLFNIRQFSSNTHF